MDENKWFSRSTYHSITKQTLFTKKWKGKRFNFFLSSKDGALEKQNNSFDGDLQKVSFRKMKLKKKLFIQKQIMIYLSRKRDSVSLENIKTFFLWKSQILFC